MLLLLSLRGTLRGYNRSEPRPVFLLLLAGACHDSAARKTTRWRVKPFTTLAAVIFALVAFHHLLRLFLRWEMTVNGLAVPMWVSILGFLITAGLAAMLWRGMVQARVTLLAKHPRLKYLFPGGIEPIERREKCYPSAWHG